MNCLSGLLEVLKTTALSSQIYWEQNYFLCNEQKSSLSNLGGGNHEKLFHMQMSHLLILLLTVHNTCKMLETLMMQYLNSK